MSVDAPAGDAPGGLLDGLAVLDDPLEARLAAADAAAWRAGIERLLPASHRVGWRAWLLRAHLALDAAEIAEILGLSSDVVRQRMSRCAAWVRAHGSGSLRVAE